MNPEHVAVVIPMYNAGRHVADVIRGIPSWVEWVVVVDDGSGDGSYDAARSVVRPGLHVVKREQNGGVGAATWTGYLEARRLGAEILVKLDADGQMNPAYLPQLVRVVADGRADYVKGNRFLHARALKRMPWRRKVGNVGLSFLVKGASGYWGLFDPTNGYTALHASMLDRIDADNINPRYFFECSMLLELGLLGAVVRDVYIPAAYGDEPSHLSEPRAFWEFPPRLLAGLVRRIRVQYFVRDFNLVSLYLVAGLAAMVVGLAFGLYHWARSAVTGELASTGTVMLAALPIILGFQLLLQAISLDVQHAPERVLHREPS